MAARCLSRLLLLAVATLLIPDPTCHARQITPKQTAESAQKQQQLPVLQALQAAATVASKGPLISVPAATTAPPTSSCSWNGATYLQGTWTFCPQCQDYSYCYCCNGAWTHCGASQDWQVSCSNALGVHHDWHDDHIMIVDPPLVRDWNTNLGQMDHHHDHDQIFDQHDHDQISDHHEDHHHEVQGSNPTNSVGHDNIPTTSLGGWDHRDSLSNPGVGGLGSTAEGLRSSGVSSHDHGSSSFGGSSLGGSSFSSHDFGSSSFGGGGFSSHDFGGSSFGGGGGGGHHGRKLLRVTRQ